MEEKDKFGDRSPTLTASTAPVDVTTRMEAVLAEEERGGAAAGKCDKLEEKDDKCFVDVPLESRALAGGWV